jgi:hypothetical protein
MEYPCEQRIGPSASLVDAISDLSEMHEGAITALVNIANSTPKIDPGIPSILVLLEVDRLGLYGERVHRFYSDFCKGSDLAAHTALRATQTGMVKEDILHHAIDNQGEGIDLCVLFTQVKSKTMQVGSRFAQGHESLSAFPAQSNPASSQSPTHRRSGKAQA